MGNVLPRLQHLPTIWRDAVPGPLHPRTLAALTGRNDPLADELVHNVADRSAIVLAELRELLHQEPTKGPGLAGVETELLVACVVPPPQPVHNGYAKVSICRHRHPL